MGSSDSQSSEPDTKASAVTMAEKASVRSPLARGLLILLAAVAFALVARQLLVHAYRVRSDSMLPTLLVGDYVLVDRLTYGAAIESPGSTTCLFTMPAFRGPRRGDVVVFRSSYGRGPEFVKRCVGLPGDTVLIRRGRVFINGEPFDDPAGFAGDSIAARTPASPPEDFGPHVVAAGHVFVLGDNRNNSEDSRTVGDVALSALRGRVILVYWSRDPASAGGWAAGVRWGRMGVSVD